LPPGRNRLGKEVRNKKKRRRQNKEEIIKLLKTKEVKRKDE
jgi:hypothetical protein